MKPGETVAVDTSLVMVESDKASMEIPSSHAGVVKEVKVKVGRQGQRRLDDPGAGGRRSAAAAPTPAPSIAAGGDRQPAAGCAFRRVLFRQGRHRMRHAGAGRRSRRLLGRLPRRRSRHEDRAGRAIRLRSAACVSTSAASRRKALLHTASVVDEVRHLRRPRHFLRRAADRPRQAARVQGRRHQEADRRPGRHGEGAQGRGGDRRRQLPRPASPRSRRGRTARRRSSSPRRSSPPAARR